MSSLPGILPLASPGLPSRISTTFPFALSPFTAFQINIFFFFSSCNDTHLHLSEVAAEKAHREKVIKNVTVAIIGRLKDFHSILLDPPKVKI